MIRNAQYTSPDQTHIVCELNHPDFGWVPFTASQDDPEEFGKELYASLQASGDVAPYAPRPVPVPAAISLKQFYMGLAKGGLITKEEALTAMRDRILPAALQATVDAIEDEEERFDAAMHLLGSNELYRSHPLVTLFAQAQGMTNDDVDNFWRLCGEQ